MLASDFVDRPALVSVCGLDRWCSRQLKIQQLFVSTNVTERHPTIVAMIQRPQYPHPYEDGPSPFVSDIIQQHRSDTYVYKNTCDGRSLEIHRLLADHCMTHSHERYTVRVV
jgi:hypothetical protein